MYEQALTIYSLLHRIQCKGHKNLRTCRHSPPTFHRDCQVPTIPQICQEAALHRGYGKSE